eukprot:TRINITY_DN2111_c0_g1_i1.p1 TRINITY_DN2111_c0_g1~~TRINITY_DN2111_c0_g1_i1.p1  ORF type:complete len:190 (+),score=41.69 TRINITY_DN2111_c0_g1_i1:273-842(+)
MPSRPKNASSIEPKVAGSSPATTCSQPWWHGSGYTTVSPAVLSQSLSKSPSLEIPNGDAATKAGSSQADVDMDKGAAVSKDIQSSAAQSDGNHGQEQQVHHATSKMPPMMAEYIAPHTQLELGHTVACASYPYSDPYGIMTAYGTQPLVCDLFLRSSAVMSQYYYVDYMGTGKFDKDFIWLLHLPFVKL